MVRKNDNMSSPMQFIEGGRVVGQFYNSWDKLHHLAEYIPYETPPRQYLCGKRGNFSPSRDSRPDRGKCPECWSDFNMYDIANDGR